MSQESLQKSNSISSISFQRIENSYEELFGTPYQSFNGASLKWPLHCLFIFHWWRDHFMFCANLLSHLTSSECFFVSNFSDWIFLPGASRGVFIWDEHGWQRWIWALLQLVSERHGLIYRSVLPLQCRWIEQQTVDLGWPILSPFYFWTSQEIFGGIQDRALKRRKKCQREQFSRHRTGGGGEETSMWVQGTQVSRKSWRITCDDIWPQCRQLKWEIQVSLKLTGQRGCSFQLRDFAPGLEIFAKSANVHSGMFTVIFSFIFLQSTRYFQGKFRHAWGSLQTKHCSVWEVSGAGPKIGTGWTHRRVPRSSEMPAMLWNCRSICFRQAQGSVGERNFPPMNRFSVFFVCCFTCLCS